MIFEEKVHSEIFNMADSQEKKDYENIKQLDSNKEVRIVSEDRSWDQHNNLKIFLVWKS